ncbi:MAG: M1 family metallopeptidase [Bacteroidetes bacterium]|nr:M1 family metallopeptidase [Bacteroidota bacterium]
MKYFSICISGLVPLFIILFIGEINAQSNLYMPKEFIIAHEKNTRSSDGRPGANYWQNKSDYKISVEVEPKTRNVKGKETIYYQNNSPDTLKRIYFRMYQDLYKPNTSRDRSVPAKELTDGVLLHSIKIDNKSIPEKSISRFETLMVISLDNPVLPYSSVQVNADWSFTIPNGTSIRMGTKDSTTFMIAYWYPQIAVYDDISGWDELLYNGNTEFYNDFNNYDVEIKVPYDFNVWGTGMLQNPEEVLSSSVLNKMNEAKKSDNIINLIDSNNILAKNYYNKNTGYNIWKFKAENVTDFVFATSDHSLWDATSAEVEPGRRVFISSVYNMDSKYFYSVDKIARDAVLFFSNEFPAVPFPFPSLTIFNGQQRGGMEFPMFVNDRSSRTYNDAVDVTTHEITHQYFPFYMGINEKKYTWMEEGMAQMIPEDLQDRLSENTNKRKSNTARYQFFAGSELEASMMTTAYLLKGDAFSSNAYFKSSVIYNLLRDYFGKEKYISLMKEYMNRWNGKHPTPYDFFNTFNEASGENLNWFWQPWFFDKGFPDLSVKEVKKGSTKSIIVIKNNGTLPLPIELTINYFDGSSDKIIKKMDIWKKGEKEIEVIDESGKDISQIKLGSDLIPDIDPSGNIYKPEN